MKKREKGEGREKESPEGGYIVESSRAGTCDPCLN